MIRKLVPGLHIPAEVLTGTSCLIIHAANKSAAGTGGARVARYRRAVMEPKAEPRKRHTREISGSIGKDCIQKQAPHKKSRTNKLTFVHFGKFLAI